MKIIDIKLIEKTYPDEMVSEIKQALKDGWESYGPLLVSKTSFYLGYKLHQIVVKYD